MRSAQSPLSWLVRQANTGLFIVYNDTRGLHDTMLSGAGRSLILKYSQLFDLIDWPSLDEGSTELRLSRLAFVLTLAEGAITVSE